MKTTITFLLITCSLSLFAQAPVIQWAKSYGGSDYDWVDAIQQTTDGGYIVAGESLSSDGDVGSNHGNGDYWIVKLDQDGTKEWERSLGGSNQDWAFSIQQTIDSGFIIAGFSYSNDGDVSGNHGEADYWVVKLDNSGNIQWQKSLGGSEEDGALSVQQTTDGGYIVAGGSNSNDGDVSGSHGDEDYWVVKLDNSGNIEWQKALGGSEDDFASSIQQTTDGGYIVAGYSFSNDGDLSGNHGYNDFWIVKLNSSGNMEWQKSYGGSDFDSAQSIQQTMDGGFIVAGDSASYNGDVSGNHGNGDYWVVKLNSSGNMEWQKSYGGSGYDGADSIQQTTDGGYIVAGYSGSNDGDVSGNHGYDDYWIVKLSPETVGIEEISAAQNIKFYPVPVQNLLTIEDIQPNSEITLVNSLGQIIYKQMVRSSRETIDCSGITSGVYTLIVKSPDHVLSSYKIIKK